MLGAAARELRHHAWLAVLQELGLAGDEAVQRPLCILAKMNCST